MQQTTVTLRFENGDSDVNTIQYAVDVLLKQIREVPPCLDARGRLVLDLSRIAGLPPIDLRTVSPHGCLDHLDLADVEITVTPGDPGMSLADGVVIGLFAVTGALSVGELAHRSQGLRDFWSGVVLPFLQRRVSADVVGEPLPEPPAAPRPWPVDDADAR